MKTLRLIAVAAAAAVAICAPSFAAAEDIASAVARWVSESGAKGPAPHGDYTVGRYEDVETRAILAFDIPSGEIVTSAVLHIDAGLVVRDDNIIKFGSVNRPSSEYAAQDGVPFFTALGNGATFGAVTPPSGNPGVIQVTLNADGIAAINNAIGGRFGLGVSNTNLDNVIGNAFVFGATLEDDAEGIKLVVTRYVPPPIPTMTEWALIGLVVALAGGASLVVLRRRRLI